MPKERIDGCDGSNIYLRVGWERERWIQLATVTDGDLDLRIGTARADVEHSDPQQAPSPDCQCLRCHTALKGPATSNGEDVVYEPTNGLHSTLDREGINRLIRVLRRARDQVYGRDE